MLIMLYIIMCIYKYTHHNSLTCRDVVLLLLLLIAFTLFVHLVYFSRAIFFILLTHSCILCPPSRQAMYVYNIRVRFSSLLHFLKL